MNKYDKMTDPQINCHVGIRLGVKEQVDYCNDINFAWPIMAKHRIDITYPNDEYEVGSAMHVRTSDLHVLDYDDKNVIRAAMIVYLMIGDSDE